MTPARPGDGLSAPQRALRKAAQQLKEEAVKMASAAKQLSEQIDETLEQGGLLQEHERIIFLTGSHARILKDWGKVEYLQAMGVVIKPLPKVR